MVKKCVSTKIADTREKRRRSPVSNLVVGVISLVYVVGYTVPNCADGDSFYEMGARTEKHKYPNTLSSGQTEMPSMRSSVPLEAC